MEDTLSLRQKIAKSNFIWITFCLLFLVWQSYRFVDDPIKVAAIVLSIATLPLLIGNRLLLICFTLFSFFAEQTISPPLVTFFGNVRWFFLGTCVVIAFVRPLITSQKPSLVWKENRWLWAFSGFALFSVFYSINPSLTILRLMPLASTFFVMSKFIKPLADSYDANRIIKILLYTALPFYFVSLLGVSASWGYAYRQDLNLTYQDIHQEQIYAHVTGIAQTYGQTRFHGIFQNPNMIGLLTGLLFPLVLVKLIQEKKNVIYLFLMTSMLICLALSASREGYLICVISGAYVLNRIYGAKRIVRLIFFVLFPTMVMLLPLLLAIIHSSWLASYLRLGTNLMLGGGRIEAWLASFQIILLRPIIGYGFGTEDRLFEKFNLKFLYHEGGYAHNSYIGMTMQLGILGTLLLFVPLFYFLFSELAAERPSLTRIGLQGMLLAALVGCMTESWIYALGNAEALPFWICMGLLEYLRDKERQSARNKMVEAT